MNANNFFSYFKKTKLCPAAWSELLGMVVLDPDGWDRSGNFQKDWERTLTMKEFFNKASESTCQYSKLYFEVSELIRKESK